MLFNEQPGVRIRVQVESACADVMFAVGIQCHDPPFGRGILAVPRPGPSLRYNIKILLLGSGLWAAFATHPAALPPLTRSRSLVEPRVVWLLC
jgi:hypothetical protein